MFLESVQLNQPAGKTRCLILSMRIFYCVYVSFSVWLICIPHNISIIALMVIYSRVLPANNTLWIRNKIVYYFRHIRRYIYCLFNSLSGVRQANKFMWNNKVVTRYNPGCIDLYIYICMQMSYGCNAFLTCSKSCSRGFLYSKPLYILRCIGHMKIMMYDSFRTCFPL